MILRRLLRDDWWKFSALASILLLNAIITIQAFPTFKQNFVAITNLIPDFFKFAKDALISAGGGERVTVFVALNHFFKDANVIGPAAAIVLALGTIVREVEIGTIGLLLSRPLSRTRILWSFIVVHVLELVLPILFVTALLPTASQALIDETIDLQPLMLAALHASTFVVMIYAFALLCAVIFSEQIRVAAVAGGVCILSFMLYFFDATRAFTAYSLSSIHTYVDLAGGGAYPWTKTLICIGLAAAFFTAATATFNRKDY